MKGKIKQKYQLKSVLNEHYLKLKIGKFSTGIALNKTCNNCFHGDNNNEDCLSSETYFN